jgi:hypothetical protein
MHNNSWEKTKKFLEYVKEKLKKIVHTKNLKNKYLVFTKVFNF